MLIEPKSWRKSLYNKRDIYYMFTLDKHGNKIPFFIIQKMCAYT